MNTYEDIINNNKKFSDLTKKHYIEKVRLLFNKNIPLNSQNQNEIIKKLKELYSKENTTFKSMLYPIIKYRELINLPNDIIKNEYQIITKEFLLKQEEQTIDKDLPSLEELKRFKNKIDKNNIQFKLIFSLYTEHPSVRNDYYNLKFKNYDSDKDNYYDKKIKKIVIRDFKTKNNYNQILVDLNRSEILLINKLIKKATGDYLFYNSINGIYTDKLFSKYIRREFEKLTGTDIGINDLRKIYVSSLDMNKPLKERKDIADKMGHSTSSAELHYKKLNIQ